MTMIKLLCFHIGAFVDLGPDTPTTSFYVSRPQVTRNTRRKIRECLPLALHEGEKDGLHTHSLPALALTSNAASQHRNDIGYPATSKAISSPTFLAKTLGASTQSSRKPRERACPS